MLGKKPHARPSFAQGDAQALLNVGRPRKAVAALIENPNQKARRLRAVAWEDLGEPRSAVLEYALLASRGDEASRFALDGYGIDAERLLLGLLSEPHPHLSAGSEAEILEVVVRHGDYLTTAVLSERLRSEVISDRATAADALVRMLDPSMRERTLHPFGVKIARHALVHASKDEVETIRLLAEEGL